MLDKSKIPEYLFKVLSLIRWFLIISLIQCGSRFAVQKLDTIDIKHQSVYFEPIKGIEILKTGSFWPEDKNIEKVLLDYIMQVWKGILVEFRRCEKYGFYRMVDSTEAPTVVISSKIVSSRIRNDSLIIPVEIKTVFKSDNRTYTLSVDASGVGTVDSTVESNTLYYLGAIFADYRRSFPYKKVVSSFYLQDK